MFCRAAVAVFGRENVVSLSYASRGPDQGLEPVRDLAGALDAVVEWSDLLGRYLLVGPGSTMTLNWNHLAPVERAEKLAQQREKDNDASPRTRTASSSSSATRPRCCDPSSRRRRARRGDRTSSISWRRPTAGS